MIFNAPSVAQTRFEAETGWLLKPEGACRGEVCVPLPAGVLEAGQVNVHAAAAALGMPVVVDGDQGLSALGPATLNGKALVTAEAPDMTLPDLDGNMVALSQFKGKKIIVYAWAPY